MKRLLFFSFFIASLSHFSQNFNDIGASIVQVNYGAAAFTDYDLDGNIDFILTGSYAPNSSVTKLYNNDGNTFNEVTATDFPNITLGAVEWGDFNNDSFPDLLMQGYIEGAELAITKIFKNNGDGTFSDIGAALPQVYQGGVSWVDFNNDGFLDFALSGFEDATSTNISKLYENNQDETFTELTSVNLPGTLLGRIKWADYDNDSYQDFILTGFGPTDFITEIWHNNGDETFTESGITLQKCWLGDVEWGDYDNDGNIDLFLSGDNGGIKYSILYQNNGDGTFTDSGESFPGLSHSSVEWADFDGDGDLDIFIAGTGDAMGSGDYYSVIYNNNSGSFTEGFVFPVNYWGDCRVADFNNDGNIDILLNGYDVNEQPYSALYKNEGTVWVPDFEFPVILSPNPTTGIIRIHSEVATLTQVTIRNSLGKICYSQPLNSHEEVLNISLETGVYIVALHTHKGVTLKKLLVI